MSKWGVQASDIFEAADRVLMGGQRPTIERVRQVLGRGSPNTVGPHLEAWYRELGERLQAATPPEQGGDGPPAVLRELLESLWKTAREQALVSIEDQRLAFESDWAERRRALEERLQETLSLEQQLKQREADLNAHIELLKEQLRLADQRLDESLRALSDKEVQLEASRRTVAQVTQQKGVLEEAVQALREEHERDAKQRSVEYHLQLTRWMAEVDRARQEKKQSEADAAQALEAQAQAAEEGLAAQRLSVQRLEKQLAEVRAVAQSRQQQLAEALTRSQEQEAVLARWQQRAEAADAQQTYYQELLAQLTNSLSESLAAQREAAAQAKQGGATEDENGSEAGSQPVPAVLSEETSSATAPTPGRVRIRKKGERSR